MVAWESRTLEVAGFTSHVIEAGKGPTVFLLHSGEYGASAETTWYDLLPRLAEAGYRAVAPDWLGFGRSDKVIDFADPSGRRMRHMAAVAHALGGEGAAYVGSSMGASYLARDLASKRPLLPAAVAVITSGGGFVPDNEARRAILDYDLTEPDMRRILTTMTYRHDLVTKPKYVRWRHELSLEPGAWACAASARLRPPTPMASGQETGTSFGKPDTTPYEHITVPTLIIAGAEDPLREPGYAEEIADRIPDSRLVVYAECGHLPNLEYPDGYAHDVISFLDERYRTQRT